MIDVRELTSVPAPARPPHDQAALYSGTAAAELRELRAPALMAISRINEAMRSVTSVALLSHGSKWGELEAALWLSPLGTTSVRAPLLPNTRLTGVWGVGEIFSALGTIAKDRAVSTKVVELPG